MLDSSPPSELSLKFAGFWIRALALLIDTVLLCAVLVPVSLLIGHRTGDFGRISRIVVEWVFPAISTTLFWHYKGGTPGKLACGLQIVDACTGARPRTTHLVNRYLGYLASTFVIGLGFFWVIWDKKKQGWHDLFADTAVVHASEPRQKKFWARVTGSAVAAAILAGGAGAVYFVRTRMAGVQLEGKKAQADGQAFGDGKSETDCVRAGFERDAQVSSFVGHLNSALFLQGCLERSHRTPEFCAEVPPETELIRSTQWRLAVCRSAGRADTYCNQLAAAVQRHCHPPATKSRGPKPAA